VAGLEREQPPAGAGVDAEEYGRYKLKKPAVPTHCVYCNPKLGDPPGGWVEGNAVVVPPFEFYSPDAVDWDTEGVWSFEAPLIQQPLYVNREKWRVLPTSVLYIPYLEAMEEDPHRVFVQQLHTHQVLSVTRTRSSPTYSQCQCSSTPTGTSGREVYTPWPNSPQEPASSTLSGWMIPSEATGSVR